MTGRKRFKRCPEASIAAAVLTLGLLTLGVARSRPEPSSTPDPAASTAATAATAAAGGPLRVFPEVTKDGGLAILELRVDPAAAGPLAAAKLQARLGEHVFAVFPAGTPGVFTALVGVPHGHPPGTHALRLEGLPPGIPGLEGAASVPLRVEEGKYRSEVLKVSPKHVSPPKKELDRILAEQAELGAIYREIRQERLWNGPFVLPVESVVTSPYGSQRVYNGKKQSFHQGLDLRAAVGTPVRVPADGIVVLAKDLFFTGYTVILDHGFGLFTVYAHLSKLEVAHGKRVKVGELLGLAGMTGRSSGPHLHWGAVVHKIKIDPMGLIEVLR
jgi:hypothetical protein